MNTNNYLYERIYRDLKNKIEKGEFPVKSLLPKEIELMEIYNASRFTIRQAMAKLENEDLIRRVKGVGTFVKPAKTDYSLSNMLSFTEIIKQQGGNPNSKLLSIELLKKNHPVFEQDDFVMNNIYQVNRIRRDGRTNLCYEQTFINADLVPNLPDYVSENVSIYDLYENQYNLHIDSGIFNLEAINANKQIANILNIKDNSPLLYMTAFVKTVDGTPLYHVKAYYVGSKYIFSTQLQR